jgi:hypothetical protein
MQDKREVLFGKNLNQLETVVKELVCLVLLLLRLPTGCTKRR